MTDTSNPTPDIPTPAPEPNAELEQLKTQVAENWDKFLRASADFDNYRKRAIREREETARFTRENGIGRAHV